MLNGRAAAWHAVWRSQASKMMSNRKEARGNGGFTILELIVVIGLTGVVMGLSSPALTAIRGHYQLDGASRQMAMEISKARMQAIAQNRTIRLRLASGNSYVFESSEDGTSYEQLGEVIPLPDGISVMNGSSGVPRFNRQGITPSTTSIIVIGSAGHKTITTSKLGRVNRL